MPLTAELVMLSPCLLFFLINIVFILISVSLLCLVRKVSHYQIRKSQNDIIATIFNKAGAIFGIMIAFVVVILWQEYNKSRDNALKEGTEALELYRDLSLYPNPKKATKAIKSLVEFANLVIAEEYPAMAAMRMSQATEQELTNLRNEVHNIIPQKTREQILYNKILRDFESLSRLRQNRLLSMESSLPFIVWAVLIAGTIIMIMFSIFLGCEKLWLHILMTSMLAIILANAFYLIIELDYPFMGDLCAKPTSYIEMLKVIKIK
jgi:Protein of unknown function (DUF4239)